MPCYRPLTAYHTTGGAITFKPSEAFFPNKPIELPCGRCLGCRLEKAKQWALRCSHEASLYNHGLDNSFITLTYRDKDLPDNGSLRRVDFQKFIRRLRKSLPHPGYYPDGKAKPKVRYYMCGEYGNKTNRPHYHAILFGHTFADRKMVNLRNGHRVYTSETLDSLWSHGDCEIGSVTFQSAGYVARYILKKQKGTPDELFNRYVIVDQSTGEMTARPNEYTNMSLKPGIGERWYEQNKSDCFPHDYCVLPDGRQTQVPDYYRNLLRKSDPDLWEILRLARVEKSQSNPDNSPERLAVRELCHETKAKKLIRDYL